MKEYIKEKVEEVIKELGYEGEVVVDVARDFQKGDWATPVALSLGGKDKVMGIAEKIKDGLNLDERVERVEVANPGFINFTVGKNYLEKEMEKVLKNQDNYGDRDDRRGEVIVIEYTDPNPFKVFHIGHLMSNTIGEALSRLLETSGASIKRLNYQGDVGLHVAMAIWGAKEGRGELVDGSAYVAGVKAAEDEKILAEIKEINKKIYKKDPEWWGMYERGRRESLEKFEEVYRTLGTKFDDYFFESEVAGFGREVVEENKGNVFEESQGAVVFKAGEYDKNLHTRVFINREGLPTYEAKELGLSRIKYNKFGYDESVVVTGNEIKAYFEVVKLAIGEIWPELAKRTKHIAHGMMKLKTGKMSSRTGQVISFEELLASVKKEIVEKLEGKEELIEKVGEKVAVAALKYSILRQSPGKDIIFDFDSALSLEGDSGVYLEYTYARIQSVLRKAKEAGKKGEVRVVESGKDLIRQVTYFSEVVLKARERLAPQILATYLHELAGDFNSFYAKERIVSEEGDSGALIAITEVVGVVIKRGMNLLGIQAVEEM